MKPERPGSELDQTYRLLAVEDNPADADLLQELLTFDGAGRWQLDVAGRLDEAIRKGRERRFHVATLDLGLPDSKGLDTLLALQDALPELPVVVLTGDQRDELGQRAVAAGAHDFLPKSGLTEEALDRTLRFAVERGTWLAQLRTVVSTISDAIIVVDETNGVRFANRAAELLVEFAGSEQVVRALDEARASELGEAEVALDVGDTQRWYEVRLGRLDWQAEPARLATLREVTDRKRAVELEKRLWQSDRLASIGRLVAGIAHEVNNPATFIMGSLELMSDELAELIPKTADPVFRRSLESNRDTLDECGLALDRIARLIGELRSFSRMEPDQIEELDVNAVVSAACSMTGNAIRHRARLIMDLGTVPPLKADSAKLTQVVTNLLVNAMQAIEPGGAESNSVTVSTGFESETITIAVEDTGMGMDAATAARAFEPFVTSKPKDGGTGLGLSLSQEIVQRHRGRIEVRSEVGRGSCFTVMLPVDNGLSVSDISSRPEPNEPLESLRVLFIDDEPTLLDVVPKLVGTQHDVVAACGGAEGIQALDADQNFDVIICDLMMPDVDGVQVLQNVRARHPGLVSRFVFSTAGALTPRTEAALASAEQPLLRKPFGARQLLACIDAVARGHRA